MIFLVFILVVIYSVGWGLETLERDSGKNNRLTDWVSKYHPNWLPWYLGIGGNAVWNPSKPWTEDFTHWCIDIRCYSMCALAMIILYPIIGWWCVVVPIISNAIFVWISNYWLTHTPFPGGFWGFIKHVFLFGAFTDNTEIYKQ